MKRSTNGGGENSPKLEGEDDFYELFFDDALIAALQNAFINIGNTDEGKQVIAIYSHNGYQKAQSSDYDNERAAQKLIQELTAAN